LGLSLSEDQQKRFPQLNELDEVQRYAIPNSTLIQEQRPRWKDKFIKKNILKDSD
jgi:hypothetical protein